MNRVVFFKMTIFLMLCSTSLWGQKNKVESVVKVCDPLTYSAENEKDGVMLIKPESQLYDAYNLEPNFVYEVGGSYNGGSLSLSLYMVNNTSQPITISELMIDVERSELDQCPYVRPAVDELRPCKLLLYNEGWGRWKEANLELSLWWNYKKVEVKKELSYFDGIYELDLFDDIVRLLGVGNEQKYKDFLEECYLDHYEAMESFAKIVSVDDVVELLMPDRSADVCICSGKIVFDDCMYVLNFNHAKIPLFLSPPLLCSSVFDNFGGRFEVSLQSDREGYSIRIPYYTELPPGRSEWVTFDVECDRTSSHEMSILIRDGSKVISENKMKLHYYKSSLYARYTK